MRLQRVEGIVLRARPFSETSLVGSLYTRQMGRIGVIARGARRPGHVAAAAFQPTNRITCSLYLREGAGLRTITDLELETSYEAIPRDPRVFGLAGYGLELVITQVPEEDPSPRVFRLLERFLSELDRASPAEAMWVLLAFELRLQKALGYGLGINTCAKCGGSLGGAIHLSLRAGGVLCAACAPSEACQEKVSAGDLAVLRALLNEPTGRRTHPAPPAEVISGLARIARTVWEMHAPTPVKASSLSFLAEFPDGVYGGAGHRGPLRPAGVAARRPPQD